MAAVVLAVVVVVVVVAAEVVVVIVFQVASTVTRLNLEDRPKTNLMICNDEEILRMGS